MKKKITIILIIGVIILIIISFGLNLYFLVWKKVEQRILERGANNIVEIIINQVKQNGEIQIGDLILVPKEESSVEQPAEGKK